MLGITAAVLTASGAAALCPVSFDLASLPSPPPLPRGVLSAVAKFGADPSGATDSTEALQTAITAARTDNFTLFLPTGCYRVTRPLHAVEPRNGRWQPVVIVGQITPDSRAPDGSPVRPTL